MTTDTRAAAPGDIRVCVTPTELAEARGLREFGVYYPPRDDEWAGALLAEAVHVAYVRSHPEPTNTGLDDMASGNFT